METKNLAFGSNARAKLLSGVNKIAAAVGSSLGPRGRTTIVASLHGGSPVCTKDGISIAKACLPLSDPEENLGAQVMKDASDTTCTIAGDGTTATICIAQDLVNSGVKLLAAGADPGSLKRGMDAATQRLVEELKKNSKPIASNQDIQNIATISANGEKMIGEMIAKAMDAVGNDGVVTIEESKGTETKLRTAVGMELDRGSLHPYFYNDAERQRAVYEDALIWLINGQINNSNHMNDMMPVLEYCSKNGTPLIVMAENIEGDALALMVVNSLKRSIKCVATKLAGYGSRRQEIAADIAVLTGATLRDATAGDDLLKDTALEELGRVKRIEVYKDRTILVGPNGREEAIEAHVKSVRSQISQESSTWDRERTEQRLAKLLGGVAVIEVAGQTEIEMKERKDRLEDALQATRAAIAEGCCVGGGAALLKARATLMAEKFTTGNDEQDLGVKLVLSACKAPFKKICENAGEMSTDHVGVLIAEITDPAKPSVGYDAQKQEVCDMMAAGIVDPVKVVRVALQNAVSASSMLLLTETLISINPTEPTQPHPGAGMMMN